MKRICILFIVICMSSFVLVGCGKSDRNESKDSSSRQSSEKSSEEDEAEDLESAEYYVVENIIGYLKSDYEPGSAYYDKDVEYDCDAYLGEMEKIDFDKTRYKITSSEFSTGDGGWILYGKVYFYDAYENCIDGCQFNSVAHKKIEITELE